MKKTWIAVANVLACFGVIILHCNAVFWTFPKGRGWYTANFLETWFYWPVPIFFMISGCTLVDYKKRYSTKAFFKKRFTRTVIPFLFWSGVAVLYRLSTMHWPSVTVKEVISGIVNTQYIDIYWFFIPLFSIYLSMPLLASVAEKDRKRLFTYLFLAGVVFISTLPTLFELAGIQYNQNIKPAVLGGYLLYVVLGYLISVTDFSKKDRIVIYIIAFLGWLIHFWGTTVVSFNAGRIMGTFKGYLNFPAVFHSLGVLVAIKSIRWTEWLGSSVVGFLVRISKYTFGIYLVHIYFVYLIPYLFHFRIGSIIWRTLGSVLVFVLSLLLCIGISKIPLLKKTIGL